MHTKSEYLQKIKNKVIYAKLYRNNYKPKFFDNLSEVKKVISSGNWNIAPYPGKYNQKFTKDFLKMHKAKYGLCLSNGTVATVPFDKHKPYFALCILRKSLVNF
tara:strand:+ start:26 stop:337 length:312 start_codon:yes stop_codon:yes gene_type:complete